MTAFDSKIPLASLNGEQEESAPSLESLIEDLMGESFVIENKLNELNLEKFGEFLEEAGVDFETALKEGQLSMEALNMRESFERCKAHYCSLLLELEKFKSGNLTQDTLDTLHQRNNRTNVHVIHKKPLESSLALEQVPVEKSPALLESLDGQELPPLELPSLSEPKAAAAPFIAVDSEIHNPARTGIAREYWALRSYFESLRQSGTFRFDSVHLDKLAVQYLCFSVESEGMEKLSPGFERLWPRRENAIGALLDNNNRRFELHPVLKAALTQVAESRADLLFDKKLPHAGILNSLRYLLASMEISRFRPTLLDMGVITFFFGQSHTLGGMPLTNLLKLKGLSQDELTELTFRLFRLQKLRTKAVSISAEFPEEFLSTAKDDALQSFELLAKVIIQL